VNTNVSYTPILPVLDSMDDGLISQSDSINLLIPDVHNSQNSLTTSDDPLPARLDSTPLDCENDITFRDIPDNLPSFDDILTCSSYTATALLTFFTELMQDNHYITTDKFD